MFCGKCGAKIEEGNSFCVNCGAKSGINISQNNSQKVIGRKNLKSISPEKLKFPPNPMRAVLFSFIVPGCGQLRNG